MEWNLNVEDIDLFRLKDLSIDLAKKVSKFGYKPQHILYIEKAGLFIANEIASYFSCPLSGIYANRSGTNIKSILKYLFRSLPKPIKHMFRKAELKSHMHFLKKERNVHIEEKLPSKELDIMIVDDAVDTGLSLKAVLEFLEMNGYIRDRIKIAALTTTQKKPVCRPDITLFEQTMLTFPWSYDSREYKKAWMIYDKLKQSRNNG